MEYCKDGGKNVKIMAEKRKELNTHAKKLLEEAQTRYEKQANKSRKEIKFKVGDLVMLNIHNFKMPKALATLFIPKYARLYKIMHKPHPDLYTLLLLTTFMAHPMFHASKLKLFKVNNKKAKRKQEYHKGFNLMEHQLAAKINCILGTKQTQNCGK
jgi:hypothetical protein